MPNAKNQDLSLTDFSKGLTMATNGFRLVGQFSDVLNLSPKAKRDVEDILKFLAFAGAVVGVIQVGRRLIQA